MTESGAHCWGLEEAEHREQLWSVRPQGSSPHTHSKDGAGLQVSTDWGSEVTGKRELWAP